MGLMYVFVSVCISTSNQEVKRCTLKKSVWECFRQILRKIFGPVSIDNIWRIRNNMEIDKLIEGADIVRFINP